MWLQHSFRKRPTSSQGPQISVTAALLKISHALNQKLKAPFYLGAPLPVLLVVTTRWLDGDSEAPTHTALSNQMTSPIKFIWKSRKLRSKLPLNKGFLTNFNAFQSMKLATLHQPCWRMNSCALRFSFDTHKIIIGINLQTSGHSQMYLLL